MILLTKFRNGNKRFNSKQLFMQPLANICPALSKQRLELPYLNSAVGEVRSKVTPNSLKIRGVIRKTQYNLLVAMSRSFLAQHMLMILVFPQY